MPVTRIATEYKFKAIHETKGSEVNIIFVRDILDGWQLPGFEEDPEKNILRLDWSKSLVQIPRKLPDSNAFVFEYDLPRSNTILCASSQEYIHGLARGVGDFLLARSAHRQSMKVILVGHGYGGLICEEVFILLRSWDLNPLKGLLLFGTAHHPHGLTQWAEMFLSRLRHEYKRKDQSIRPESLDQPDIFGGIHAMQTNLRQILRKNPGQARVICLYAQLPDEFVNTSISKEWTTLPWARPVALHSSHFDMSMDSHLQLVSPNLPPAKASLAQAFPSTALEILVQVVHSSENTERQRNDMDLFTLPDSGVFDESSRPNDPSLRFDPEAAKHYYILPESSEPNGELKLGDIIASTNSSPIATMATTEECLPAGFESDKTLPSVTVRNKFADWKPMSRVARPNTTWNYIVRHEWSRERSAQYMAAALKLKHVEATLPAYLVIGVLQGSPLSDISQVGYSRDEPVMGYRLLRVSIETNPAIPRAMFKQDATSSKENFVQTPSRNRRQLVLEDELPRVHASADPLPTPEMSPSPIRRDQSPIPIKPVSKETREDSALSVPPTKKRLAREFTLTIQEKIKKRLPRFGRRKRRNGH